jgi:hypothetical protein
MDRLSLVALALAFMLFLPLVSAHQPRLTMDLAIHDENSSLLVKDPQVSQAFYGELDGQPDYYRIVLGRPAQIYFGITAPDMPGQQTDFSVELYDHKDTAITQVFLLDGAAFQWKQFYEPFGGDWYLQGPAATENLTNVTYYVKVSSPSNQGRYALAIGDEEAFPLGEVINAYLLLPVIKQQFFEKPVAFWFVEFFGIILAMGSFLAGSGLILTANKVRMKSAAYAYGKLEYMIWPGMLLLAASLIYAFIYNPFNILGTLRIGTFLLLIILLSHANRRVPNLEATTPWTLKLSMALSILLWLLFLLLSAALI